MPNGLFAPLHLLFAGFSARRDTHVRFLKAQVAILRRKLAGNRAIPSPDDRARLLAIGQELDHNIADVIGIVTPQTYCRWVEEPRTGRKPKRVGRPKVVRSVRELVTSLARQNGGWGYRWIIGELRGLCLRIAYARDGLAAPRRPPILTASVVAACIVPWRGARIAARSPRNHVRLDVDPR